MKNPSRHFNGSNIMIQYSKEECLLFGNEMWKYTAAETLQSSNLNLAPNNLTSNEDEIPSSYVPVYGQKPFTKFQAQWLPLYSLINSYKSEEEPFTKTFELVHGSDMQKDSNIITSHVIYKVKSNDDGTFKMKARIAPQRQQRQRKRISKSRLLHVSTYSHKTTSINWHDYEMASR